MLIAEEVVRPPGRRAEAGVRDLEVPDPHGRVLRGRRRALDPGPRGGREEVQGALRQDDGQGPGHGGAGRRPQEDGVLLHGDNGPRRGIPGS